MCQQQLGGIRICTGVWAWRDGSSPLRCAPLVLLPAEMQTEAAQGWTFTLLTENMLVHDPGHLQELLPRPACDETAVHGPALQLDGCDVIYAFLHRLCGGRPV